MRLLSLFCGMCALFVALFKMPDPAERNLFYRQMNGVMAGPNRAQVERIVRRALAQAEEEFCQPSFPSDCKEWLSFYYLRWGRKVTELEDVTEANYYYSASVAVDPGNADAYFWWGLHNYRNGEPEKAETFFRMAVSEHDENMNFGRSDALFYLAQSIAERESPADWEAAVPYLQAALDTNDFQLSPERRKALTYYSLAESKRQLGSYEEAVQYYSQALSENDTVYWAYLRLAEVNCRYLNACADVEDYLKAAISLRPDSGQAYVRLAEHYVALEQYSQAEAMLKTALEINADDSSAKNLLEQIKKELVE